MALDVPAPEPTTSPLGDDRSFRDSPVPSDLPGRWQPIRLVGHGGQADVWLTRDRELNQLVALKVFHVKERSNGIERLRREVRLGRELSHPNLVRLFEFIDCGSHMAVAMEWVPGGTLAQRLRTIPLSMAEVEQVATEALAALAHLHSRGVVHRDVKPSNLLLAEDGTVKLADLGLARPSAEDVRLTRTAMAVGTPGYMSPEQIRGQKLSPAADLYGLGATIFEAVTGHLPFSGNSGYEVADRHLNAPVPDPRSLRRDCPAWLARFILRLLAKDPADRWPDAESAAAALASRRIRLRLRWGRTAVAAGLLAAAAGGIWVAGLSAGRHPVNARVVDGELLALDAREQLLWRRPLPEGHAVVTVADIAGDRLPEVVAAIGMPEEETGIERAELRVFSAAGQMTSVISVPSPNFSMYFPQFSPSFGLAIPMPLQTRADGGNELFWIAHHRPWYPAELGYWPSRSGGEAGSLLMNSGHLFDLAPIPGNRSRGPLLVVTGINNPMGYQTFVALLRLARAPARTVPVDGASPDHTRQWLYSHKSHHGTSVLSYIPLGPLRESIEIIEASREGVLLRLGQQILNLDPAGNLRGFPAEGMGPGPRQAFWYALAEACQEIERGEGEAEHLQQVLAANHSAILAEPGSLLAADLLLARASARSGRQCQTVEFLAQARHRSPASADLILRQGEQFVLMGDAGSAYERFEEAFSATAHGGRDPFSMIRSMLLAAIHWKSGSHYQQGLHAAQRHYGDGFLNLGVIQDAAALWSFALGEWQAESLFDQAPASHIPTAAVARLWAQHFRGDHPEQTAKHFERLALHPGLLPAAQLMAAYLDLEQGLHEPAREKLATAVSQLEMRARTSMESLFWLPAGYLLQARAADAGGDFRTADGFRTAAAELSPQHEFPFLAAARHESGKTFVSPRP